MDKKFKIILALFGVLVMTGLVAVSPYSEGLMGYLRLVPARTDVAPVAQKEGLANIDLNNLPAVTGVVGGDPVKSAGLVSVRSELLDDFFYIDRYDVSAVNPVLPSKPYNLPNVAELISENWRQVEGIGLANSSILAPKKSYRVAFAYVDFDYEGDFIVFSEEEQGVLKNVQRALPGVFGNASNFLVGLDVSYPLKKVYVPAEYSFDVKYNWLSSSMAAKLSRMFFENNPDEFDFIVFYGKHLSGMSRFTPVKEESKGKGCKNSYGNEEYGADVCEQCFDYGADFGSGGRLKGVTVMSVGGVDQSGGYQIAAGPSSCAMAMEAGAHGTMLKNVHYVFNDYAACDAALAELDKAVGAPFWMVALLVHELEHQWGMWVFPYDEALFMQNLANFPQNVREMLLKFYSLAYGSHYRYAVQGESSVDPHGALRYEWVTEEAGDGSGSVGLAKVCLQDLYPYQPLKFHPITLHLMGLDSGVDAEKQYRAINIFGANKSGNFMDVLRIAGGCAYLKPSSASSMSTVSVRDIVDFWGPVEMCQ